MNVGFHAGISPEGYLKTIVSAQQIGCDSAQIWLGNPKGYHSKVIENTPEIQQVKDYVETSDFFLISHSPYIINFARKCDETSLPLKRYVRDLENITKLGGFGSVVHMGFNVPELHQSLEDACKVYVDNLEKVIDLAPRDVTIILENMAGKGTSMCCEMEQWSYFWNECFPESVKKRCKWCIDTAHLYATGEYDISQRKESVRFYEDFDNLMDWDSIACFHFNGSLAPFGAKKDLHADIGPEKCGVIETKGLRKLARIAFKTGKPLIMEVPGNEYSVESQVNLIKSWGK